MLTKDDSVELTVPPLAWTLHSLSPYFAALTAAFTVRVASFTAALAGLLLLAFLYPVVAIGVLPDGYLPVPA